jgi:hypothetical protein
MRVIAILVLSILFLSCMQTQESVYGKVTSVSTLYKSDSVKYIYQSNLPLIEFRITIKNQTNDPIVVNIKDYGRESPAESGSFFLFYGQEQDSLELFSASCKNCLESISINQKDSIAISLQTEFNDLIKLSKEPSSGAIENTITNIISTWSSIEYYDGKGRLFFSVPRN